MIEEIQINAQLLDSSPITLGSVNASNTSNDSSSAVESPLSKKRKIVKEDEKAILNGSADPTDASSSSDLDVGFPHSELFGAESAFSQGCPWTGRLKERAAHLEKHCGFVTVLCEMCKKLRTRRHQLQVHQLSCPARMIVCEHCAEKLSFGSRSTHLRSHCKNVPLECEYGCMLDGEPLPMTRDELAEHETVCPFKEILYVLWLALSQFWVAEVLSKKFLDRLVWLWFHGLRRAFIDFDVTGVRRN